jgi:hypothetical protein
MSLTTRLPHSVSHRLAVLAAAAIALIAALGIHAASASAIGCVNNAYFSHVAGNGYFASAGSNCGLPGNFTLDMYVKRNGVVQQQFRGNSNFGSLLMTRQIVPLTCGVNYQVVAVMTPSDGTPAQVFSTGAPHPVCA